MCLCNNGLTSEEELISSNFRGIYGAAALFHSVKNIQYGRDNVIYFLKSLFFVKFIYKKKKVVNYPLTKTVRASRDVDW